jgi:hypothetical protein
VQSGNAPLLFGCFNRFRLCLGLEQQVKQYPNNGGGCDGGKFQPEINSPAPFSQNVLKDLKNIFFILLNFIFQKFHFSNLFMRNKQPFFYFLERPKKSRKGGMHTPRSPLCILPARNRFIAGCVFEMFFLLLFSELLPCKRIYNIV